MYDEPHFAASASASRVERTPRHAKPPNRLDRDADPLRALRSKDLVTFVEAEIDRNCSYTASRGL
jgi:hypothetical protein